MAVAAVAVAAIAPLHPDPRLSTCICLYLSTPSPVSSPPCLPPPPQRRHRQTIPPFSPARLRDSPELPLPATFFVRIRLVHRDKAASKPFYQSTEKIRGDPSATAPRTTLQTYPRVVRNCRRVALCYRRLLLRFDSININCFLHSCSISRPNTHGRACMYIRVHT